MNQNHGIKVYTIGSELDSARRLGFDTTTCIWDRTEEFDSNIVIRWGNSGRHYNKNDYLSEFKNVINNWKSISLNCRKQLALKKLSTVVNTPKIFEKEVPKGVLAVVRPTAHSSGAGFSVRTGPLNLNRDVYATQFIKTDKEFRTWFCGDQVIGAKRVPLKDIKVDKFPCRSAWGYKFCNIPEKLKQQTLLAAKTIGLEVGAADILYHNKKYYFLELNSGVTVDTKTIREFYQTNLIKLIKKKFPEFKLDNPIIST